jgi:pimeloyl-ACP methyl ester carboxylesterase
MSRSPVEEKPSKARRRVKSFLMGCGVLTLLLLAGIIGLAAWMLPGSGPIEVTEYHPFRTAEARERFLTLYDQRAQRWPVPSENRTVSTSHGTTFVRISGPVGAPPLVLLHGVSGNSLQWMPNIEALSQEFRVYAVDGITDHGRSVYTRAIESPEDYARWLDELFNGLELRDRIQLVGLSYGGWLTSQYALRFPERLDKIVLVAPVGTVLPLRMEWIRRAALSALPHRRFTRDFMYWLLEDLVRGDEAGQRMVDEWVEESYVALRSFKPKHMVNPTVLEDSDWKRLKVPTLYLVGENEKIYSAREAVQRLAAVAPQVEVAVIPRAGHDLTIVQAERVNGTILEFLKRPRL